MARYVPPNLKAKTRPKEIQKQGGYPYNNILTLIRHIYLNTAVKELSKEDPFTEYFRGIKETEVQEMVYKTLINGEYYTIRKWGTLGSVVFYLCTECPHVSNTKGSADTHALQSHDATIGENVNVIKEYLQSQDHILAGTNKSTIRESQISLKMKGPKIPSGNNYDWSKIEIASPITFNYVEGSCFHTKLEEDLRKYHLALVINEKRDPFRLCKLVIQTLHGRLLTNYSLKNKLGYYKEKELRHFLLEVPDYEKGK